MQLRSGRTLATLVCATALTVAAVVPADAAAGCRVKRGAAPGSAATKMLCLVNDARARRGLHRLRPSSRLGRAANGHARDMVRHHYLSHTSRRGSSLERRVERAGYRRSRRWAVGETLGWDSTASARVVLRGWLASPIHRSILLSRAFRDIGVGGVRQAPDGGSGATFVVNVGRR
jgi:uncharacterized protein YkwD